MRKQPTVSPQFVLLIMLGVGFASTAMSQVNVDKVQGVSGVSANGAATYTIPIEQPLGRNGINLPLAITYSSQDGGGMLGPGWSLAGLSSISRCRSTVGQNGAPAAISLTTADKYCLNGNQLRLVSGTYGASGSVYRTEIDTFQKISAVGNGVNGPVSFSMRTKDGLTYNFGLNANARINAGSSSTPYQWLLEQILDTNGNNLVVTYQNGSPLRISYGDHEHSGNHSVVFEYQAQELADKVTEYVGGHLLQQQWRLEAIGVNTASFEPYTNRNYTYRMTYEPSPTTGHQRLKTITKCHGIWTCGTPTTITYQNGQSGVSTAATTIATGSIQSGNDVWAPRTADVDGDGKEEMLFATNDGGGYLRWWLKFSSGALIDTNIRVLTNEYVVVDDFLGSGSAQIIAQSAGTWHAYQWNGTAMASLSIALPLDPIGMAGIVPVDINGDGRTDLVWEEWDGYLYSRLNQSTGSSIQFSSSKVNSQISIEQGDTLGVQIVQSKRTRTDIDGDGRGDIFVITSVIDWNTYWSAVSVYGLLSRPNGTFQYMTILQNSSANVDNIVALDWNDDACTDFVMSNVLYLTGCNGGVATTLTAPPGIIAAMDWDHDGRKDMVTRLGSSLYWHRSVATSISAAASAGISVSGEGEWRALDYDGDGQEDLAFITSGGGTQSISMRLHNSSGQHPDVVTKIEDRYGIAGLFEYNSTAQAAYARIWPGVSAAAYPLREYTKPLYVVGLYTVTDNAANPSASPRTYQQSFNYGAAREELLGRGLSGFSGKRTFDSRNSFYTFERWKTAFPYTGVVESVNVYRQNLVTPVSLTLNTITADVLEASQNNQRYFPFIEQSTTNVHEVDGPQSGQHLSTRTLVVDYDAYGNLTSSTEKLYDLDDDLSWNVSTVPWETVTINSMTIDQSTWCVGLPNLTTVTRKLPDGTQLVQTVEYAVDTLKCRPTRQTLEPNGNALRADVEFQYHPCGRVEYVTVKGRDRNSNPLLDRVTRNTYETLYGYARTCGFPNGHVDALGQSTYNYLSLFGQSLYISDPNLISVARTFGEDHLPVQEIREGNWTVTDWVYTVCDSGNNYCGTGLTDVRWKSEQKEREWSGTPLLASNQSWYDGMNRIRRVATQMSTGDWSFVDTTYNKMGLIETVSNPFTLSSGSNGKVLSEHDALGRLRYTKLQNALGVTDRTIENVYAGRTVITYDAKQQPTWKTYDVTGALRLSVDPAPTGTGAPGGSTNYSYTYNTSQKTRTDTITDPAGNTSSATTNVRGFKVSHTDPDMGTWSSAYNSLGELETQTDAKGQTVSFQYDKLGRVKKRTEDEGDTDWVWGTSASAKNIGQLASVTSPGGYFETHEYDSMGRTSVVKYTYSSVEYRYDYTYNSLNQLATTTYPQSTGTNRLVTQNIYSYGHLTQVKEAGGNPFWTLNASNERHSPTDESLGNGVRTISEFDPLTGQLRFRYSGAGSSTNNLQNFEFKWDPNGNLDQRISLMSQGPTETFQYDALNRMTQSQVTGKSAVTVEYNSIGNIVRRNDVGGNALWVYDSAKKHAVRDAGGNTYDYDANGNMSTRNGSDVYWTSYNFPKRIDSSTSTSRFFYGAHRNRFKQEATYSGVAEDTVYAGGLFEQVTIPGAVIYRHYIAAGGTKIVYTRATSTSQVVVSYLNSDHLGGTSLITGAGGSPTVHENFYPFGKRRDPSDWDGPPSSADLQAIGNTTRHGFTGHEHLDNLTLIHMNGRVYDPTIGRFMSADPFIQAPDYSQSLNRYSYVWNNPLSLTDPTGFEVGDCVWVESRDAPGGGSYVCPVETVDGNRWTRYDDIATSFWLSVYIYLDYSGAMDGGGNGNQGPADAPPTQCWNGEQGNFLNGVNGMGRQIGNDLYNLLRDGSPIPFTGALAGAMHGDNPFGSDNTSAGIFGADLAPAAEVLLGGVAGVQSAGVRGAGMEFSHWIPARAGGPRSIINGNFVSTRVHALSDPFRYRFMPRTWKANNPLPSALQQQFTRIPDLLKGIGAGRGAAATASAARAGC